MQPVVSPVGDKDNRHHPFSVQRLTLRQGVELRLKFADQWFKNGVKRTYRNRWKTIEDRFLVLDLEMMLEKTQARLLR
jgi:hypothetical protein